MLSFKQKGYGKVGMYVKMMDSHLFKMRHLNIQQYNHRCARVENPGGGSRSFRIFQGKGIYYISGFLKREEVL